MCKITSIAIYGGSFDPPHFGHLKTALAIQRSFHFDHFHFVPCKDPVLKNSTVAASQHRVAMLELALHEFNAFRIDLREIKRDSPSYMVETLQSFRDEFGKNVSITLILGQDAFQQLPAWYHWEDILRLSHLLVMKRPVAKEMIYTEQLRIYLESHKTSDASDLLNPTLGRIFFFDAGAFDISSTWLRNHLYSEKNIRDYLPEPVLQYIYQHHLYSPLPHK